MKIAYDPWVDILRIAFIDVPVEESDQVKPGFIFDCDTDGNVVGMEILHASEQIDDPKSMAYTLAS